MSTGDIVGSGGTLEDHLTYSSFGELAAQSGPATYSATDVILGAYTGSFYDSATGLVHDGLRWYQPAIQQWLSEDPIGLWSGDTNFKRYVGNDPVNEVDPTGLAPPGTITQSQLDQMFYSAVALPAGSPERAQAWSQYTSTAAATADQRPEDFSQPGYHSAPPNSCDRAQLQNEMNSSQNSQNDRDDASDKYRHRGYADEDRVANSAAMQANWDKMGVPRWAQALADFFAPASVNPNAVNFDNVVMALGSGGVAVVAVRNYYQGSGPGADAGGFCGVGNPLTAQGGKVAAMEQDASAPSNISADARQIANGHAWTKHGAEFPEFSNPNEFAQHVDSVMMNPTASKGLANGRQAFWDDASQTVVIRDPNHPDMGTAFRPGNGRAYYDGLK